MAAITRNISHTSPVAMAKYTMGTVGMASDAIVLLSCAVCMVLDNLVTTSGGLLFLLMFKYGFCTVLDFFV